jgi:hypothetical protein
MVIVIVQRRDRSLIAMAIYGVARIPSRASFSYSQQTGSSGVLVFCFFELFTHVTFQFGCEIVDAMWQVERELID